MCNLSKPLRKLRLLNVPLFVISCSHVFSATTAEAFGSANRSWKIIDDKSLESSVVIKNADHSSALFESNTWVKNANFGTSKFITVRMLNSKFSYDLQFVRFDTEKSLRLIGLRVSPNRSLFLDGDGGEFSVTPPEPHREHSALTASNCSTNDENARASLGAALATASEFPRIQDCGDRTQKVHSLIKSLSTTPPANGKSVMQCQMDLPAYSLEATKLELIFNLSIPSKFTCSTEGKTRFDQSTSKVLIGTELNLNSTDQARSAIYHEIIHSLGIQNEVETRALVKCCSDTPSDCSAAIGFSALRILQQNYNGVENLVEALTNGNSSRESVRDIALSILKERARLFKCGSHDRMSPSASSAARKQFDSFIVSKCRSSNVTAICDGIRDSLKSSEGLNATPRSCSEIGPLVAQLERTNGVRKFDSAAQMPTASAEPAVSANVRGPVAPQELRVTTAGTQSTRDPVVRRDLERHEQFLGAVGTQANRVASSVMSSLGSTAYASVPALPQRNADGSTSAVPSRVEGDRQFLRISDTQEISASIPTFGDSVGQARIEIRDVRTGKSLPISNANAGLVASTGAGTSIDVASQAANSRANLTGNSALAKTSDRASSDARSTASADSGSNSSTATSSSGGSVSATGGATSSGTNAQTRNLANNAAGGTVSTSTLKRMFARSADPAVEINSHLEDLRANSMQVRYRGTWYPRDFVGTPNERFDLDLARQRLGPSR